jgi:predicted permease
MPDWKKEISDRLDTLNLEPAKEAEIVEELAQHLEDRYQELLGEGCSPEEARRTTQRELSEHDQLVTGMRRFTWRRNPETAVLETAVGRNPVGRLWQDFRYSLRMLRKSPGVTLIIVLSIGLAIGANTTVFTWLESLVLNPTPLVKDNGMLVAVNSANKDGIGGEADPFSYLTYLDWRDKTQSFDGLIAHTIIRLNVRQGNEPQGEPVWGEIVSGNYFDVLGVPAVLGRTFSLDEERSAAPVTVLNYRLWQRRFGGDGSVIGRQIRLNGAQFTVIGVAPEGFEGVLAAYSHDLWIPVTLQPVLQGRNRISDRNDRWLQGTARLKRGVTLVQANEEMRLLARNISQGRGETPITGAVVKLMRERFSGVGFYPLFSALLAVTALVLLIACANVANLLLARAAARGKEISIRLALGAKRSHIIRQLMTESLLLSLIGGCAGLLFARWAKGFVIMLSPPTPQPRFWSLEMDWRTILVAFLVTVFTALVFGLVPALRAAKTDLVTALKEEGRGASSSRSRLRSALIIAQVALSLVALVSAGLFLRSMREAQRIDVGFSDPNHLLLLGTDFNMAGLKREDGLAAADRLLERVRALSGVSSASLSTMVPLGFGGHAYTPTKVEGYVLAPDEDVTIERVIVSDDYFETMGVPIVEGRGITAQDRSDAQRVAVVNEAFAKRYYPGQDPIGKRTDQGQGWATVVGVAKNGKYRELNEAPSPLIYSSLQQWYVPAITLHIRTVNNPKMLTETARSVFAGINANLPILDPRTMTEHMGAATFRQSFGAVTLSTFGVLALLITAVGLYGVLSYFVTQRRKEIAIRMAIGATPTQVMNLVLKQGLLLTLIGIIVGSGFAWIVGRLMQSQVLEVSKSDPLTFIGGVLLLIAMATAASFVPARRATKVDPLVALKYE